jgi:hypothetical protein
MVAKRLTWETPKIGDYFGPIGINLHCQSLAKCPVEDLMKQKTELN